MAHAAGLVSRHDFIEQFSGQLVQRFIFNAQALHDRCGGMPITPLGVDKVGQRFERGCQEEGASPLYRGPANPRQEPALGNPSEAE